MRLLLLSALALLPTIACSVAKADSPTPTPRPTPIPVPVPQNVEATHGVLTTGDPYLLVSWNAPPEHRDLGVYLEIYTNGKSIQNAVSGLVSSRDRDLMYSGCKGARNHLLMTGQCVFRYNQIQMYPKRYFPENFMKSGNVYEVRVLFQGHGGGSYSAWPRYSDVIISKPAPSAQATPTPSPTSTPWPTASPTATPWPTPIPPPTTAPMPTPTAMALSAPDSRYRVHGVDSATADGLGRPLKNGWHNSKGTTFIRWSRWPGTGCW